MTKVIVVTSGKGGVGKTTTSASIAAGLAMEGYKTALIDFDIGLRNLDLVLGCERRVVYDFINVINGEAKLNQAFIRKDKNKLSNLYFLAASQSADKTALTTEGVEKIINEIKEEHFDYVICDSPAGIEEGAQHAMYFADEAIIVVNPEISSVRDADKIIGFLDAKTEKAKRNEELKKHLLITRYDSKRVDNQEMLSIEEIQDILKIDVIGVIPETDKVITYSNNGEPVILSSEDKKNPYAGLAYEDVIKRLNGENIGLRYLTIPGKSIFNKIFGG